MQPLLASRSPAGTLRRATVALLYAGASATTLLLQNKVPRDGSGFGRYAVALLASIVVSLACAGAVTWRGRMRSHAPGDARDATRRSLRDTAYRSAYGVVGFGLVAVAQFMVLGPGFGWPTPDRAEWISPGWTALLVVSTLPSALRVVAG